MVIKLSNEFLESVLYDWHNVNILGRQNNDISFYEKYVISHNIKHVIVVGAGTGRVAIPLSKITNVDALDISVGRLLRLSEHDNKINIIARDFSKKIDFNTKYDLVIFPYSTLQAINNNHYINVLLNVKQILCEKGTCLIDIDNSFKSATSQKRTLKCEGYCKRIKKFIEEYITVVKLKNGIKVIRDFCVGGIDYFVVEKWYSFNENQFINLLMKTGFEKTRIYYGYKKEKNAHKMIIEIMHKGNTNI